MLNLNTVNMTTEEHNAYVEADRYARGNGKVSETYYVWLAAREFYHDKWTAPESDAEREADERELRGLNERNPI